MLFRQIPTGSRLLAIGNFFRGVTTGEQWRLAAFIEESYQLKPHRFALEMSCVLAVGREFVGEENSPYRSRGYKKTLILPSPEKWRERPLGECAFLAKRLTLNPEIAGQRCFVFEVDGLTVWLPKFELARKLFFHSACLVRAAFEPNGLDMLFNTHKEKDGFHIHTLPDTGVPSQLIKIKEYRDHFSWLLLEQDVKRSFESIWRSLNQEQASGKSGYARWKFNFTPPASLSGVTMDAQGHFDQESNTLLVWEVKALQGLRFTHGGDIFFHHPALRLQVRGEGGGCVPVASEGEEIEVDAEEEPGEAGGWKQIDLPTEGIGFDVQVATRIAYNGERASSHGKKGDDEQLPGGQSKVVGIADPVSGGSIVAGELQQLEGRSGQEQYADRFTQLSEIIRQIVNESDIELLALEMKPLPWVLRCSYHMVDNETPRCYLMARFRMNTGCERYLLEIDTSDNRKPMSTRIMGLNAGDETGEFIDRILRATVKGSLRWPGTMADYCKPLHSVHHPKESLLGANHARVFDWKQRIRAALS